MCFFFFLFCTTRTLVHDCIWDTTHGVFLIHRHRNKNTRTQQYCFMSCAACHSDSDVDGPPTGTLLNRRRVYPRVVHIVRSRLPATKFLRRPDPYDVRSLSLNRWRRTSQTRSATSRAIKCASRHTRSRGEGSGDAWSEGCKWSVYVCV